MACDTRDVGVERCNIVVQPSDLIVAIVLVVAVGQDQERLRQEAGGRPFESKIRTAIDIRVIDR